MESHAPVSVALNFFYILQYIYSVLRLNVKYFIGAAFL